MKNYKRFKPRAIRRQLMLASVMLTPFYAANATAQTEAPPTYYNDGATEDGIFIRGHGFALFTLPSTGALSKYQGLLNPTLTNTATGQKMVLTRKVGYGGGFTVGYNFGASFIDAGFDYSKQDFSTNNQSGEIKNNMLLIGAGVRLGGALAFTIGTEYGLNMMRISGILPAGTSSSAGKAGRKDDHDDHDDNDIELLQHNVIAMLQLDYTFADFISVGGFGKYYYGFTTKGKGYNLSDEHTIAGGAFVSVAF
ncbi:MAG: hypothetical protein QM529_06805 [Hydrotalea sp.]|nr:hypothetical protein [Hydrotalea sp.]